MPSIEFQLKDLNTLLGRNLSVDEVERLSEYAKAELDEYDEKTDTLFFSCADTNVPYLWSVEGFVRLFRGALGIETGIPSLPITPSKHVITVDPSITPIRPHILAFTATGKKIDEYMLKQIIQLQEKLCTSYGRRRKKVAIGMYPLGNITFPLTYKAVLPDGVRFIPLEGDKQMTPAEILEHHPTGQKYAFILEGQKQYPLLVDSKKEVLSFPPIINSHTLGKVEVGEENLFIEMTGTDSEALHLCATIFAYALAERGFEISSVTTKYADKEVIAPSVETEKVTITLGHVKALLGIDLKEKEVKDLLEKMRYTVQGLEVEIPPYRKDFLHPVDIIEDIGIMYGYENIPTSPIETHTVGDIDPLILFAEKARSIMVGLGFVEALSPMLTNKALLYEKMNCKDFGTIEIESFISENYAVIRTWILPMLFDMLSKNKHHEYPQKVFESGLVTVKKGKKIADYKRLAAVHCGVDADYTKARQMIDLLLNSFAVDYEVGEVEHPSFIPGRVARVFVKGKGIAFVGEFHPQVLENFDIQMPVAGFELNLSELFELKK